MGMLQQLQSPGYKNPVFAQQGHDICHCAQTYHIRIFCQCGLLIAADGGGQLKGNANAGQIHMGIAIIGAVGVYHSHSLREDILAFMVIRNDQFHAHLLAQLGFFHGRDAAVHGDDQLDTLCGQLTDGNGIQTVAFLQSAGDVADAICTLRPQKMGQQAGGSNSVHIIVAEYGDLFSPGQGKADPANGQIHIRHFKGTGQGFVTS